MAEARTSRQRMCCRRPQSRPPPGLSHSTRRCWRRCRDTADFDNAARGFLGTIEHARITSAQGRVVWSLEPYGFLSEAKAPVVS